MDITVCVPLPEGNAAEVSLLSFCTLKNSQHPANTMFTFDNAHSIIIDTCPDDDNKRSGSDLAISSKSQSFAKFMDNFYRLNLDFWDKYVLDKVQ